MCNFSADEAVESGRERRRRASLATVCQSCRSCSPTRAGVADLVPAELGAFSPRCTHTLSSLAGIVQNFLAHLLPCPPRWATLTGAPRRPVGIGAEPDRRDAGRAAARPPRQILFTARRRAASGTRRAGTRRRRPTSPPPHGAAVAAGGAAAPPSARAVAQLDRHGAAGLSSRRCRPTCSRAPLGGVGTTSSALRPEEAAAQVVRERAAAAAARAPAGAAQRAARRGAARRPPLRRRRPPRPVRRPDPHLPPPRLPAPSTPYLNGDFVDRGVYGVEVTLTLFASQLHPTSVYLNPATTRRSRCTRCTASSTSASRSTTSSYEAFAAAFEHLPLATIVNDAVFVVHGARARRRPARPPPCARPRPAPRAPPPPSPPPSLTPPHCTTGVDDDPLDLPDNAPRPNTSSASGSAAGAGAHPPHMRAKTRSSRRATSPSGPINSAL